MLRRALHVFGAVASLALIGCQHQLANDGSYVELRDHAMRLDYEFNRFHLDLKQLLFGIEQKPPGSIWQIYDR